MKGEGPSQTQHNTPAGELAPGAAPIGRDGGRERKREREREEIRDRPDGQCNDAAGDGVFQVITFSRLKNRVGGYHRDYLVLVVWCWLCGVAGPQTTRSTSTSPLTSSSHVSGRLCLGLRRSRRSEACAAYDLAGIYIAQGRVYGVQHVRGHDPGPGDHGTLSAREPVPTRQAAVGLEASSAIRHPI